ncbi:hypothetical protein CT0861_03859 [Colletotrichum tofieldiae]|uniref:Uncharacterized protein n=1 Tax=Colletotrichum tofieldiae TaxID=708197 RepID=A0A166SRU9_9PEZI|nr:hypothetical protein CT0861_03859 [Colletotrichum tofieldiae]
MEESGQSLRCPTARAEQGGCPRDRHGVSNPPSLKEKGRHDAAQKPCERGAKVKSRPDYADYTQPEPDAKGGEKEIGGSEQKEPTERIVPLITTDGGYMERHDGAGTLLISLTSLVGLTWWWCWWHGADTFEVDFELASRAT